MEVYNDYNSNLTNLFFCVKERPLALITELGFLPLNSRDDFDAIYRQLKCEEFDDEYLAIELELADKYFSPLHAYKINTNHAIFVLRRYVVEMLLSDSPRKQKKLFAKIESELLQNLSPIRKDRSFSRAQKHLTLKFPFNVKCH